MLRRCEVTESRSGDWKRKTSSKVGTELRPLLSLLFKGLEVWLLGMALLIFSPSSGRSALPHHTALLALLALQKLPLLILYLQSDSSSLLCADLLQRDDFCPEGLLV